MLNHVCLFSTLWTASHQAPVSMQFSRQEYWSGWPFPTPGDLPSPGIKPASLASAGEFFITTPPAAAAAAKSLQSCPTLCDPRDGSPPGSPVPGILQARTLEWVAFSFSNAWKWKVKVKSLNCVRLLVTPWTAGKPQITLWLGSSAPWYSQSSCGWILCWHIHLLAKAYL